MKNILIFVLFFNLFNTNSFKEKQLKYSRVRQAYSDMETNMLSILEKKGIDIGKLKIYLRAFKKDKEIELWGKNFQDKSYSLIKTYKICRTSGNLGPKREQGDLQIPEGFYHIDRFNPNSNFYLSLGLNYPNRSDRILGTKGKLGGDIFIHGSCVTIGCLPIQDDPIKELYIFCVEAKNNGQSKIPVTIFPTKLTDNNLHQLRNKYNKSSDKIGLWDDLKQCYDIFNETHELPSIIFLNSGRHKVQRN